MKEIIACVEGSKVQSFEDAKCFEVYKVLADELGIL